MQAETYEVAGGWHAYDPTLRIACFGLTREDAAAALATAQAEWLRLRAMAAAGIKRDLGVEVALRDALTGRNGQKSPGV